MKINLFLLPMKLHFFFVFGGTAPLIPYLPVYMHQELHMSYKTIGLIYTILPFFGLISKGASGAIADSFHLHRTIFLSSIILCGVSFFSIYFVPAMSTQPNPSPGHIQFDCSSQSYLRHVLTERKCDDDFSISGTTTCELECDVTTKEVQEICSYWNIPLAQCSEEVFEVSVFSYLNHTLTNKNEVFFPVSNLTYLGTEVEKPTCNRVIRVNCTTRCDDDRLMSYLGAPNTLLLSTYSDILHQKEFWIYLLCIGLAWSGLAICIVMSDTICFKLLGAEPHKYGNQRLFGSIGWGLVVILAGLLIDMNSDMSHKNYIGAFILAICILSIDFLVATRLQVKGDGSHHSSNLSAILSLARYPRILLFVVCCFLVGLSTGVLWTYQLLLVEQTVNAWDCSFEHMKLLQGLIIGVACFGGELPFFFISGVFIKKLGHVHSMSLVIGMFGLRFVLYSFVSNPWLFLPIELLNGFTFGIFYTVMTSYASIVAPPGTEATVQGIFGATFEGLGVASGGIIGGALFASVGGPKAFLYVGILNAGFSIVHVLIQILLSKMLPQPSGSSPLGYVPPSESQNPVTEEKDACLD